MLETVVSGHRDAPPTLRTMVYLNQAVLSAGIRMSRLRCAPETRRGSVVADAWNIGNRCVASVKVSVEDK